MNKRLEEEISLAIQHKSRPSLTRLLMPGVGRPAAASVPLEAALPSFSTIQASRQVGDRRAAAVLAGRAPDLTGDELESLVASVDARNERISELTQAAYDRIDRIISDLEAGHGNAD